LSVSCAKRSKELRGREERHIACRGVDRRTRGSYSSLKNYTIRDMWTNRASVVIKRRFIQVNHLFFLLLLHCQVLLLLLLLLHLLFILFILFSLFSLAPLRLRKIVLRIPKRTILHHRFSAHAFYAIKAALTSALHTLVLIDVSQRLFL